MSNDLSTMTSPEAAESFARSRTAVIPLGSVEQHGPHLPNGTDIFAAELVARATAESLDAVYVPLSPYGVTPIHAGHPGTVTLRRETFEMLLTDVCSELIALGIRTLVLVNWHEGNIASMDAVATDLQHRTEAVFISAQACYTAQRVYREAGGELTHGGGIETLAVMAYDPALAKVDRAGEPTRPEGADALDAMRRSSEVYGFVTDVSELADDGWYGNPWWATSDRATAFPTLVAQEIVERVRSVVAAHEARS
ncbi:creatininase family protein [Georgenia yuyongxinii]|uniref:Creatininase family protein n=1 Tax=Georgenia yuyongxinii TaxID=2589797 RepID=A0A5B8C466_9MICO|nr:creatininase family protein [Georgenia yuyongxinii]QDC24947.1 creatininase family protein [Georgenia yuyongxinii]